MKLGEPAHITLALRDREGTLYEPEGALTLLIVTPKGVEHTRAYPADIEKLSEGQFARDELTTETGLWNYRWLDAGQAVGEGTFTVESHFDQGLEPDLTDLRVLVPRARRKVEGPWGNANNKPPLTDDELRDMVADACGEIIMLGGKLFKHKLEVKRRDPLVGFPTEWKTDQPLEEYEASIICAQVALNYYFHVFNNMRTSQTIQNEGTVWTYELSAGVIKEYLKGLVNERDAAITGLRINNPIMDRYVSNIRVRDQATVALLEWWDTNSSAVSGGGLPSGQEASVVPAIYPPGVEP